MDHLPSPSGSLPPVRIPFLCREEYDGLGFDDYPERKGYQKDEISAGDWPADRLGEAASFLQAWLYFGLMTVVFGTPIRLSDFYREIDGKRIVTTSLLPIYLKKWHSRFSKLLVDEKRNYLNKVDAYLELPVNFTIGRHQAPPDSDIPAVSFSIDILRETLWAARMSLSRQIGDDLSSEEEWAEAMEYNPSSFLENRMLSRGWCPNEIGRIRVKELSAATVHYLGCMPRYLRDLDHAGCTEAECKLSNIDEATYQTRHVSPKCLCKHISPDIGNIGSIISEGKIPLIATKNTSRGLYVEVLEWEEGVEYVAVSHVWLDGLGNVSANSLPECQILRLHNLVESMCSTPIKGPRIHPDPISQKLSYRLRKGVRSLLNRTRVIFWIDTLCVPVGEKNRSLRDQAILRMKDTYQNSYKMLVLDAELERFSGLQSPEECFARVFSSLWMRRCWTAQEFALAKRTYIRFSDTLFDLDAVLLPEQFDIKPKMLHWPNGLDISFKYDTIFFHFSNVLRIMFLVRVYLEYDEYSKNETDVVKFFCHAWNCMTWRETSKSRDKFLIFAQLLRLDITEILKAGLNEDRMRLILSSQKYLPADLISIDCPRMQKLGYKWAPSDFPLNEMDLPTPKYHGIVDNSGFRVTCPGLILSGTASTSIIYHWKDKNIDQWYNIFHEFPEARSQEQDPEYPQGECVTCYIFTDPTLVSAARVRLGGREDGVLIVDYECPASMTESVEHFLPALKESETRNLAEIELDGKKMPIVQGERVDELQQWCIR